jgi:hypothetical protein
MNPIVSEPRTLIHAQPRKVDGNASISNRYQTLRDRVESYMMRTCLSSLSSSETTLKSDHNFLIESLSHLHTAFLRQERQFNYIPAHRLGQGMSD